MQTKATKTGNSISVLIPNYMTKFLGIEKGTKLNIDLQKKKIKKKKEEEN